MKKKMIHYWAEKSLEEVGKALQEEQTVNKPTERNTRLRPRGLGRQASSTRQSSGEQSTRQASASSARKQLTGEETMHRIIAYISMVAALAFAQNALCAAKDTDGNDVVPTTAVGDIDAAVTTVGDLRDVMTPDYGGITNAVGGLTNTVDSLTNTVDSLTNTVANITNATFQGYGYPFTPWTNNAAAFTPPLLLTEPVFTNNVAWVFTITNADGSVRYERTLWDVPGGENALYLEDQQYTEGVIVFGRTGTPIYTNNSGLATLDNLKQYVQHPELNRKLNDYVSNDTLEQYDASYEIVKGITNLNQTIQIVMYTNDAVNTLRVEIPKSGRCKDWVVYVVAKTNVVVDLPTATYWAKSESVTNDIAGGSPTALYFSQALPGEDCFTIGRQEFVPMLIERASENPSLTEIMLSLTARKGQRSSYIPRVTAKKKETSTVAPVKVPVTTATTTNAEKK